MYLLYNLVWLLEFLQYFIQIDINLLFIGYITKEYTKQLLNVQIISQ